MLSCFFRASLLLKSQPKKISTRLLSSSALSPRSRLSTLLLPHPLRHIPTAPTPADLRRRARQGCSAERSPPEFPAPPLVAKSLLCPHYAPPCLRPSHFLAPADRRCAVLPREPARANPSGAARAPERETPPARPDPGCLIQESGLTWEHF